MTRFKGNIKTDKSVEIPVMVTESANSALNKEHHPRRETKMKCILCEHDKNHNRIITWTERTHNSNKIHPATMSRPVVWFQQQQGGWESSQWQILQRAKWWIAVTDQSKERFDCEVVFAYDRHRRLLTFQRRGKTAVYAIRFRQLYFPWWLTD